MAEQWCRVCTFSSRGYDNYIYCNWHKSYMEQYDWCDHFEWGETDAGGSGCYIATATLAMPQRSETLHTLRAWRQENMRPHRLGRWLESQYDSIGPRVVDRIVDDANGRQWYYRWFVAPSVSLVKRQAQSTHPKVYAAAVYCMLIAGIVTGRLHVWARKSGK